jgi:hypothetical protein
LHRAYRSAGRRYIPGAAARPCWPQHSDPLSQGQRPVRPGSGWSNLPPEQHCHSQPGASLPTLVPWTEAACSILPASIDPPPQHTHVQQEWQQVSAGAGQCGDVASSATTPATQPTTLAVPRLRALGNTRQVLDPRQVLPEVDARPPCTATAVRRPMLHLPECHTAHLGTLDTASTRQPAQWLPALPLCCSATGGPHPDAAVVWCRTCSSQTGASAACAERVWGAAGWTHSTVEHVLCTAMVFRRPGNLEPGSTGQCQHVRGSIQRPCTSLLRVPAEVFGCWCASFSTHSGSGSSGSRC